MRAFRFSLHNRGVRWEMRKYIDQFVEQCSMVPQNSILSDLYEKCNDDLDSSEECIK